jgi:alpha-beta hydrolase superfamily lysophospholipase
MDLPGHGRSQGERGHVNSFSEFNDAASGLLNSIQQQHPSLPIFLLGHSMGGLIAARFLLDNQQQFKGAVLSAAAIQSPQEPPAWQVGLIKGFAKIFPKAGVLALDATGISRDQSVYEKYVNDPLVNQGKLSAKFLVELSSTMETVQNRSKELSLPMMIMHGTADKMTAPHGSELVYNQSQSGDKELKLYEGLYHEIFNEPEQELVIADLTNWLDAHCD